MSERQTAARLAGVAVIAGLCCGVVDYLGSASLTVAAIFAVPSCAAISTLEPKRGAVYGAAGGILLGFVAALSSALSDDDAGAVLTSLSEGFIIGGIVGTCAGLASSLIARTLTHKRPSQLAGAGGGVAVGALVALAGIVAASPFAAVSGGTLGLFAVSWLALPFTNAALDYLSLGISHTLGHHILTSTARAFSIFLVLILDLFLAVALMIVTIVMIGLGLYTITWGFGIETFSDVFLENSATDPWGVGLWLTTMVLSTTLWTWLHYGLILAPLLAGLITRQLVEVPANKRLDQARQENDFDITVGVLVALRLVTFYLCWVIIALLPAIILLVKPEVMEYVLWLGWRLTVFFL